MRNFTLVVLVLIQLVCLVEYNSTSLNEAGATALSGTAGAEPVKTIKVNFTTAAYPGGSEWNDLITFTAGSSLALNDSLGNASDYTINVVNAWNGGGSFGNTEGPYPLNVNKSYWSYIAANMPLSLEITNLNNSNTYYLEFYGSRSATGVIRQDRVTIGDKYDIIDVMGNTSDKAIFKSVSPSSGTISASFTLEGDTEFGYLNAMVIKEYASESPAVTISATDDSAAEQNQDQGTFTVSRTTTSGDLSVLYSVSGTASSDDYTQTLSGSVTIADGSSTATIIITPVDDSSVESSEAVILTLAAGTGYTVGTSSAATVTIADNDMASSEPVKTVKVNFTTAALPGGSEWNDFTTIAAGSSLALNDSLGNASGYTITNINVWNGSGGLGMVAGPYPENVNKSYWSFTAIMILDLEISNLNNSNTYYLEFYGSRNSTGQVRTVRVTIGDKYDIMEDVMQNTSEKAIFKSVSPTSGTISARVTLDAGEFGYLNAIVLREYQGTTSSPENPVGNTIVQVYPNPFCDVLRLSNTEDIIRAEMVNMSGKTLIVKQNPQAPGINIDTKSLQSGVYILRLFDNTGAVSTHKVVK